jgi:hypothetical protein
MLWVSGCKRNDNPAEVQSTLSAPTATDDAAESVAGALGANNGGALDQMGDVLEITTSAGLQTDPVDLISRFEGRSSAAVQKQYDSTTGWWTLTLTRTRGIPGGTYYTSLTRVYQYQFLNRNGGFQKFWRTVNPDSSVDTAYSVHHIIKSGTGISHTRRMSQQLLSVTGEWIATGTNTPTITINTVNSSPFTQVGADTVTTGNSVRTLNYTLTMTFLNVTGPRGGRSTLSARTSGTINGTYHATVSLTRGSIYSERTIDRTFTVTLGSSKGMIAIDGRRYSADLDFGEVL